MGVSKEARAPNPEEYLCPIYVHCILPFTTDLFPAVSGGSCTTLHDAASVHNEVAVMHIPMETTEDVEDCKMFSIAVHSGHRVTLPE